jgi:hypothetical protein
MKFALGSFIKYTNKNTKTEIFGTVIAGEHDMHLVLVEGGKTNSQLGRTSFYKNYASTFLSQYFNKDATYNTLYRTKSDKAIWISARSKNLVSGVLTYDATQQGDTDEDI